MSEKELSRKQAIAMLWNRGIIAWKLHEGQKRLYDSYHNATGKVVVWSCSRRLGKSYALSLIAVEQCHKKANSIVKYIAPTTKHVKQIIMPIIRDILKDCPKELRPRYYTHDNAYRFPNGSEIQMAGADQGHAEALRGGSSDLCIVDEAGFIMDDLRYIIQSILLPTTTTTQGKIVLSSTPPVSADHDFNKYMKEAEFKGNFVKMTIYDNPMLTPKVVQEIIEEYGGVQNPDFRREYLCEVIIDEDHAVVPEFSNEEVQKICIQEWPIPPFADRYVGGDIGFKDLTVFLFGFFDFKKNKVIIEDELVMSGKKMTTEYMAQQIKEKETKLWTHPLTKEQAAPYLRVCDNNLIVINDLQRLHSINFVPTPKDDKIAALNNMRIMIQQGRIIIHPRCKTLIYHLKNATWAKSKKTYDRSADAGHYDAVDALSYLVRNITYSHNPYPSNYGMGGPDEWFQSANNALTNNPTFNSIKNVFAIKRSLKR